MGFLISFVCHNLNIDMCFYVFYILEIDFSFFFVYLQNKYVLKKLTIVMKHKQHLELEVLVKEVIKRQDRIVPIVGDDCFVGYIENEGKQILAPLQQWIAVNLLGDESTNDMKNKISIEGYRGLDMLFDEYKRINDDCGFVDYKDVVASLIEDGIRDKKLFLREDVKNFLLVGKFEVVATTCPYHILEKEITYGNVKYNVSSFAPISLTKVSKSESALKLPSIYQIFGDCDGEFVAGEEDLLKFLHYLNQTDTEKGYGASQLVKYIKDKGQDNKGLGLLMPIECNNLPDWLFRFLWYPFSQERLIGSDKRNQGGVWHKYTNDENFYKYLRKYRFKTFSDSTDVLKDENVSGDPVLLRLTKEFKSKETSLQRYVSEKLQVQWKDTDDWDLFISYASEDEEIARKVYDVLTENCGKKVWMDNRGRIKAGDEYWTAIQHGIEHSHGFIFIITNNYLSKAIDKNHRYETGEIEPTGVYQEIERVKQFFLAKRRDGQKGYTFPLIIEGTKVTYTDYNGVLHKDEILKAGMLEKLHKFKEYEMLQTDVLFHHIQDFTCTMQNLEENLVNLFNN